MVADSGIVNDDGHIWHDGERLKERLIAFGREWRAQVENDRPRLDTLFSLSSALPSGFLGTV